MQIVSHAQTHVGLIRQVNEDACLELPEQGIWAVADGMGGHAAGDVASQLVLDSIRSAVVGRSNEEISKELLIRTLEEANSSLQSYSRNQLEGNTAGTTVVVLFLEKQQFHLLWVGDSRGYLLRNENLKQTTRDHSQVSEMVEQGLISEEEAEHHECANVITRAIGVEPDVAVDIISGECSPGDIFLLCTDGLNKELPDVEIARYLKNADVMEAGMALLHSSLVAGARDNVTYVIVEIKGLQEDEAADNETEKTIPVLNKIR
ncbi:PP2C family protein-serine/threonine phosphatase [Litoribrevibacter albus]|uniref:Serine/threonine protein phosphatase n=1 Tax=Litoribrevibacter albus TaxID=1473156 RepID=A0AA37SBU7_9GAMM|nr:protein phosphatase 2C domain-containing protein [Litoribrevibacter albus]GLQ31849.1 serine/threonine protein phosphatase [Litoribrevibacter albus]